MSKELQNKHLPSHSREEGSLINDCSGRLFLTAEFNTFMENGVSECFTYYSGGPLVYNGSTNWYSEGDYKKVSMDRGFYYDAVSFLAKKTNLPTDKILRKIIPIAHVPGREGDFPLVVQAVSSGMKNGRGIHGAYFELKDSGDFLRLESF
jgi:hypothetical protein